MLEIIRGTTPSIVMTVQTEIDLQQVTEVWIYVSQQKAVKIDKKIDDATFDYEHRKITVTFSQEETLGLKAGEALFQVRMLLSNGTALATIAADITVIEIYKQGVITEEE